MTPSGLKTISVKPIVTKQRNKTLNFMKGKTFKKRPLFNIYSLTETITSIKL
jgi:hypothetical protein